MTGNRPKQTMKSLAAGQEFIEFLGGRISMNKTELRAIYNEEFRHREGAKHPNFYSVFSALRSFQIIYEENGRIYTNVNSQVKVDSYKPKQQGSSQPCIQSNGGQKTESSGKPSAAQAKKVRAAEIQKMMRRDRERMIENKNGIVITSKPKSKEGRVQFSSSPQPQPFEVTFCIKNVGTDGVFFTGYTVLDRIRCFRCQDEKKVTNTNLLCLCSGESYDVKCCCPLDQCGFFRATICFEFLLNYSTPWIFDIVREINVEVRTSLAEQLRPVAPYKPIKAVRSRPATSRVVKGVPPRSSTVSQLKTEVRLRNVWCPKYLKNLAEKRMDPKLLSHPTEKQEAVKKCLQSSSDMNNYSHRFHLLLFLEEIQMEKDIKRYNLCNETMTKDPKNNNLLIIKVEGVAENRPSLLKGDRLKVTRSGDKSSLTYIGYVHKVELDKVTLSFNPLLMKIFIPEMKFDVEFTLNKLTLNLQHRAVDLAEKHRLGEVLFPSGAKVPSGTLPKLRMFNRQLEGNPEQRNAVRHIVAGSSKPAPYVIFGPPGTGKTITVVEAITQINRADRSAHILACAPSNSAADQLCERLKGYVDSHKLYRMNAHNRDFSSISNSLLKYCNWDERERCVVFPKKEVLMEYKIIVTTLYTAGRLVTGGIPVGHFTHVFIDEAGQAEEPQCVIAVAGVLCPEKGQLVLAGDPKQLGPIILSSYAETYGLGLSLLERLMKHKLYQDFDPRFVTKLLQNYRSHGAILKVPNELFYNNELQVFADQLKRDTYCQWDFLPQKGFPVIFHGVVGKDEREENSPSFFNVSEVEVLVKYLNHLVETQGKKGLPKLSANDIGIITPYRKQVEKIRKALRSTRTFNQWDLKELKVGSVEEFQGRERKIIMVSTVRSDPGFVKIDKDFNIGFVSNKKRFNVAMTRAKSLLIVVGNPVILRKEPIWKTFISYCVEMKGYDGFDLKDDDDDDNDDDDDGGTNYVGMMASLRIMDSEDPVGEESAFQRYVNPEWKNDI